MSKITTIKNHPNYGKLLELCEETPPMKQKGATLYWVDYVNRPTIEHVDGWHTPKQIESLLDKG